MAIELGKSQHTLFLCAVIMAIMYFAGPVLLPFILGVGIAWTLLRPTLWLQRRGVDRRVSAAVATLLFSALVALVFVLAAPVVIGLVQTTIAALPDVIPRVTELLEGATNMAVTEPLEDIIEEVGDGDVSSLVEPATKATPILFSFIGSTLNTLLLVVITPFALFYALTDWRYLTRGIGRMLPEESYNELLRIWDISKDRGLKYIRGRLIVVVCMMAIHIAGLLLIGLNQAVALGALAGVSVLVPVIGNVFALGVALVVGLLQFDSLLPLAAIGAVFAFGQILEMVVIEPYFLGDTMDMHPFVILLVLMLGGHLLGVIGAVVALPVTAIIVALLNAYKDPTSEAADGES